MMPIIKNEWIDYDGDTFSTMEEVKCFLLGGEMLHEGYPLQFKWHPKTPGDGRRTSMFICKSHQNCPYVVKGVFSGGTYKVQMIRGVSHSYAAQSVIRTNSCWTDQQLQQVKKLMDAGCKPAQIETSLTKDVLRKCRSQKVEAEKRDDGGLVGARFPRHMHNAFDKMHENTSEYAAKYVSEYSLNMCQKTD